MPTSGSDFLFVLKAEVSWLYSTAEQASSSLNPYTTSLANPCQPTPILLHFTESFAKLFFSTG
ncbi:5843_t:CDS:2, partial [Acaulospora colombiana]